MVVLKCCVGGCTSTNETHRLFSFTKFDHIRDLWLSFLVPTNPLLAELTKYQLVNKRVCSKHFDKHQFDVQGHRLRDAYPCLLSDLEIALGEPRNVAVKRNSRSELEYCSTLHVEHNYAASSPTAHHADGKPGVAESCADAGDSGAVQEPRVDNTDICDGGDNDADDSDPPVKSNVCRVCLALDVKLYDLKDIALRETFQNITGIAVTENNHPILERLCWECAGRLRAAAAFRNKALLSDALLQRIASTGEHIRRNDFTLIKEKEDYLKSAATLSVIEVFHTVEIEPDNESLHSISANNEIKMVQNIRRDSIELKESIIEENNSQMDVKDESMDEAPIKTEIEYDSLSPNTGEENRNVDIVLDINTHNSNNIPLIEDTINSAYSSVLPGGSNVAKNYTIVGYLPRSPGEDKIQKTLIKITKQRSKIVSKKPKLIDLNQTHLKGDAKFENINVKVGGVSKKASNQKLVKKTQVRANTYTDEEYLSLEDIEF